MWGLTVRKERIYYKETIGLRVFFTRGCNIRLFFQRSKLLIELFLSLRDMTDVIWRVFA